MDSAPSITAVSDENTSIIRPSESRGEIVHPNVSPTSEDEDHPGSLSDVQSDLSPASSVASSHIDPVDEQSTSDGDSISYNDNYYAWWYRYQRVSESTRQEGARIDHIFQRITLPIVNISAFTETGQAEASIKVPKQRSYTGRSPVIPSSLADTPCATLGVQGVLDRLNATLGTSHTFDTPSVLSLLEECIEQKYDFGTVYGRLRKVWNRYRDSNMQDKLCRREEKDRRCGKKHW